LDEFEKEERRRGEIKERRRKKEAEPNNHNFERKMHIKAPTNLGTDQGIDKNVEVLSFS
jgi:hypothetical protein